MNKAIPALTLLCGFLLGVVTGPWIWPQHLLVPAADPVEASVAQIEPAPVPAEPQIKAQPAQTPSEPKMQLKGVFVVGDGSRSVALIKSGDWQPQPYRVDQKLPNGYVVKSIDKNSVDVEKEGQSLTLPLLRASSETESEPTEPETTETESTQTPAEPEVTEAVATEAPVASEAETETTAPVAEREN